MTQIDKDGKTIYHVKGDTFVVHFNFYDDSITNKKFQKYDMKLGDVATFTLRKEVDSEILLQKTLEQDGTLAIPHTEMELEPGKYVYDVQLDTADGTRQSVIKSSFRIVADITY